MRIHLFILVIFVVQSINYLNAEPKTIILTHKKAEDLAIQNSPEIRILKSQRSIKRMLVNENWRNYFPTASISWFRNTNIIENDPDSRSQRLALNLEQVVYDGGRRKLSLDAALNDLKLSKYDFLIKLNQKKYGVRNAFYELLSYKAMGEIQKKSIDRQKQQLYFANKELSLGDTTQVQVLQIENRLNEILLQNQRTDSAFINTLEEFKILLRLPNDVNVRILTDILEGTEFYHKKFEFEDLSTIAFNSRIEFDRTKAREMQTLAEHKIAKSYYIPTFSLGGFYASADDRFLPLQREFGVNFRVSMALGPNTFEDSSNYISRNQNSNRSLTNSTTMGIYDNMKYQREIAQSGIAATEAKIERRELGNKIKIEVNRALQNYDLAWNSLLLANQNSVVFDKRLRIKMKQVELGDSTRAELAETEIFYLEAINEKINARVRYLQSLSELELAVGANLDSLNLAVFKDQI